MCAPMKCLSTVSKSIALPGFTSNEREVTNTACLGNCAVYLLKDSLH